MIKCQIIILNGHVVVAVLSISLLLSVNGLLERLILGFAKVYLNFFRAFPWGEGVQHHTPLFNSIKDDLITSHYTQKSTFWAQHSIQLIFKWKIHMNLDGFQAQERWQSKDNYNYYFVLIHLNPLRTFYWVISPQSAELTIKNGQNSIITEQ